MTIGSQEPAGKPDAVNTVPRGVEARGPSARRVGARRGTARPLRALLCGLVLLPGWAILMVALAGATAKSWSAAAAAGPARAEDAVGVLAGIAALGAAGWLGAAAAVSALATAHPGGRIGAAARTVSQRLAPAILRRAIALGLGVTVLGSPVTATAEAHVHPPTAVTSAARIASTVPSTTAGLAPGWTPAPAARRARDAGLDPGWAALSPPARASSRAITAIVARRGDTLWDLAARHLGPGATDAEIAREWPRWYAANRTVIGADPDHLEPEQRLIPPGTDPRGHAGTERAAGRADRP